MDEKGKPDRPAKGFLSPMTTWRENLEFLIDLSCKDITKLVTGKPGDLDNLWFDLVRFNRLSLEFYKKHLGEIRGEPEQLRLIIEKIGELLDALVGGKPFGHELEAGTKLEFEGGRTKDERPSAWFSSPHLLQATLLTAAVWFSEAKGSTLIRRCVESPCKRIFLARRKSQKFCSHKCASAAASRAYKGPKKKRGTSVS